MPQPTVSNGALTSLNRSLLQRLTGALNVAEPHTSGLYKLLQKRDFAALGLDIRLEGATNRGRIAMSVLFDGQVFSSSSRWWN
jgi:hypothetical protein